jgi:hypothetical protein
MECIIKKKLKQREYFHGAHFVSFEELSQMLSLIILYFAKEGNMPVKRVLQQQLK